MIRILRQLFAAGIMTKPLPLEPEAEIVKVGARLEEAIRHRFQRSLTIREVDAGSCNGCELEIHALNNPIYNCERFGIHFTASPRFADILLVTGPVSRNMEIAVRRTWDATPPPKFVIAVGDCGANGGIFGESYASLGGVEKVLPVDLVIRGCPPMPVDLLWGILKLVEKDQGAKGVVPRP